MGAEEDKGTGKEGRAAEVREKEEEKEGQEGTSTHDEGEETDVSSVVATKGGTVASPPAGDRDDEGTPSSCNQTLEPATQLAPNPPTGSVGQYFKTRAHNARAGLRKEELGLGSLFLSQPRACKSRAHLRSCSRISQYLCYNNVIAVSCLLV